MSVKNREGWPKSFSKADGETRLDFGIISRPESDRKIRFDMKDAESAEKAFASIVGQLPQSSLVILQDIRGKLLRHIESKSEFEDILKRLDTLIREIDFAMQLIRDGDADNAARVAFNLGLELGMLEVDRIWRNEVQAKRNSRAGAGKPRGWSHPWEVVRQSYKQGQTWQSALKVFREAGGTSDQESFRRDFRKRFRKSGTRP